MIVLFFKSNNKHEIVYKFVVYFQHDIFECSTVTYNV